MHRVLLASITILAVQGSAWACDACEELGHHWHLPAYRAEMMTQIALMAGVSVAIVGGVWLKQTLQKRRARQ